MLKIKAILFDLVGTLIYVKDSVGTVYSNIAKSFGIEADPKKLDNSFLNVIHNEPPPTGGEKEEKKWWRKIVYETFVGACHGMPLPQQIFDQIFEAIYKEFTRKSTWGIYPDVIPTLEKLHGVGADPCVCPIKIGLISNFDNRLEIILKEINLFKYLDTLSYSGKVGFSKPDPRIFQFALKELNVLPEEAIYIGDSLDDDYYPACDLSISAILIDRDKKCLDKNVKKITGLDEIFVLDVIARRLE